MKFEKSIIVALCLCLLMIGSVSATSDINDSIASSSVSDDVILHTEDSGNVGEKTNFDSDDDNLKKTEASKNIDVGISQDNTVDVKSVSNVDTVKNTKLDDSISTNDNGEYVDITEAFTYLNEFRAEEGVWYWNEDDTTKTIFNTNSSNQLQSLRWSSDLEQTALIRAKEIAEKFSHTRPDGTHCFTAYPNGLRAKGENIAYGYRTCKSVTEAWKETNDPYNGQGHRRNMLSTDFNCVGIAGYKVNGIIYWVHCFGYKKNIENEEPAYPIPIAKLNAPIDTSHTDMNSGTNHTNGPSNKLLTKKITKLTASKKKHSNLKLK